MLLVSQGTLPLAGPVDRAIVAIDATTDGRPEPHDYSIKHVFPKLGETGTPQDIIDLLGTRSA